MIGGKTFHLLGMVLWIYRKFYDKKDDYDILDMHKR
jgi:hypothetical protein